MTTSNDTTQEDIKLFSDITSYIYGIAVLLTLSSVMLILHLYLAFFFHN